MVVWYRDVRSATEFTRRQCGCRGVGPGIGAVLASPSSLVLRWGYRTERLVRRRKTIHCRTRVPSGPRTWVGYLSAVGNRRREGEVPPALTKNHTTHLHHDRFTDKLNRHLLAWVSATFAAAHLSQELTEVYNLNFPGMG